MVAYRYCKLSKESQVKCWEYFITRKLKLASLDASESSSSRLDFLLLLIMAVANLD